ncbi:MAG TPA: hypothetical protein VLT32_11700 [Candidatus Sulfomarinibacteraceae bacterium]|nr:hypothetical protein [Candidatus Sulfomarinibacteraceae bacterium]
MAARLVLVGAAVLATMIPSLWASDSLEASNSNVVAATASTTAVRAVSVDGGPQAICKPTISSKVSVKNRRKFLDAFDVALERVQDFPECRGLFTELEADGMKALDMIVVLPIGRAQAQGGVCRGTSAYTLVGGGPIWVCRDFSRLSDTQAAMVIIHEALHHAGLSEYPQDPGAMTSTIINQMVMKKCGL